MKLQKCSIADLQPHPANYNKHPKTQINELVKSLDMFDQFKNIVVCQGRILAGHGIVEAAKQKGMTEIYALVRDDLSEDQQKALLVADNAAPLFAQADTKALEELLESLPTDFPIPGATDQWLEKMGLSKTDEVYSKMVAGPVYEPTGEQPALPELFNTDKTNALIEEIKTANITADEAAFLVEAARRHTVFNYRKIAEYYAHAPKNIQELMEKSALVIIDFEKAIEYGYTRLTQEITNEYTKEYDNQ